jgi:hypothetical protein
MLEKRDLCACEADRFRPCGVSIAKLRQTERFLYVAEPSPMQKHQEF